jgi:hypothetical protein
MIIANGALSLKLTFALRPTNNIDIRIYDINI